MANTLVRRNEGSIVPGVGYEFDPWRMMRDLLRWDPFHEMAPATTTGVAAAFIPAFEVKETKEGYTFKADLPGVKEKDLEISLTGNRLTVSGKRDAEKEEKTDTYYAYERSYGSFTRAFTLPEGVDIEHVRADLKDGVLTMIVPKLPEVQPKKVAITPISAEKGKA